MGLTFESQFEATELEQAEKYVTTAITSLEMDVLRGAYSWNSDGTESAALQLPLIFEISAETARERGLMKSETMETIFQVMDVLALAKLKLNTSDDTQRKLAEVSEQNEGMVKGIAQSSETTEISSQEMDAQVLERLNQPTNDMEVQKIQKMFARLEVTE
jgi:fructose 1,6-bisphosphatase